MAAGEFVSVSSQRDAELAEMAREKRELDEDPDAELRELTTIYMRRGLDNALAARVAKALSAGDRLGAHLRDELGFDPHSTAQPFQAACASAISFAFFASIPIVALLLSPTSLRIPVISIVSLVSLVSLGAFGAHLGGAPWKRAVVRVCLGGILAMGTTAVLGRLVGAG